MTPDAGDRDNFLVFSERHSTMFFDEKLPPKTPGETRIAHLSDLHVSLRQSNIEDQTRRFLKRPIAASLEWTARVVEDMRQHEIDHLVITGDLTENGRRAEFAAVREALGDFDDPARLTLVPGNHDVSYHGILNAPRSFLHSPRRFRAFLDEFGHLMPETYPDEMDLAKRALFPMVKFVGCDASIALVGIDTTNGFSARVPGLNSLGKVGRAQFGDIRDALRSPAVARRTRIVLMHHHPMIVPFYNWFDNFKSLRNAKRLLDLLYDARIDLILHGHKHQPFCWQSHTFDEHDMSVVCAGPPDAYAHGAARPRELIYNIYALREGAIHVHYQRCPVSVSRRAFSYSRRNPDASARTRPQAERQ